MNLVEAVNLLQSKSGPLRFVGFWSNIVEYEMCNGPVIVLTEIDENRVVVGELIDDEVTDTPTSKWVQSILEGNVRDEDGNMVAAPKPYTY